MTSSSTYGRIASAFTVNEVARPIEVIVSPEASLEEMVTISILSASRQEP